MRLMRLVKSCGSRTVSPPSDAAPATGMPATTVPKPLAEKARSSGMRKTPSARLGVMDRTRPSRASRNGSNPSPVTFESGRIGAPSRNVPCRKPRQVGKHLLPPRVVHPIDLRQRHQSVAKSQEGEDVEMLAGLGHDAVVGGHHQDHAVHAARPGDHRLDETLVAGHVDDAHLQVA